VLAAGGVLTIGFVLLVAAFEPGVAALRASRLSVMAEV
jgi:hypothetical protein